MHERVYDSPTEHRHAIAETYPELVQAYASQGLRGPLPALDRPSTSQQVLSTAVTCGATAALALGLSWAAARLVAWSVAAAVPATLVATLLTLAGLQYVARPLGDRVAGIRREVPVRAGR